MKHYYFWLCLFASGTQINAANRFVTAGAPAPDREWIGSDYVAFAKSIQSSETSLPTLADADGKEIILRAVSRENFGFYKNSIIPIPQRLQSFLEFQQGLNQVMLAYAAAANRKMKVQRELADLLVMTLHTSVVMLDLLDEFVTSNPATEAQQAQRETGLRQVRKGITSVVNGTEVSLSERTFYGAKELTSILQAMAETLPRLTSDYTENQIVELRNRLSKRKSEFKEKTDLALVETMLQSLSTSRPSPARK